MGLTDAGFYRPTIDEIVAEKSDRAKLLFGDDIDTGEQSVLGKFIRIDAYMENKLYEDLELTYYSRFPSYATGISLDRACVFVGISRNAATHAQHSVTFTGTAGHEIPLGFLVSKGDVQFYTVENVTLTGGTGTVDVMAVEPGIVGNVSDIDTIVNPDADVESVEYDELVSLGEERETDVELRKRFEAARDGAGSSNVNAIRSSVLKVPTVNSCQIIENETDTSRTIGTLTLPARSFVSFVNGGSAYEDEIARAIFDKKPIGIGTAGTTTKTIQDDGGTSHSIAFSYTSNINLAIAISVNVTSALSATGLADIKSNLADYINNLGAGSDVIYNSLFAKAYAVTGVAEVTALTIGTTGGTLGTSNISVSEWQIAAISADNITVTATTV